MDKKIYEKKEKHKKVLMRIFSIMVLLVIIVLIFMSNDNLRNRMGSVLGCKYACSKGYQLDEITNTCYQEHKQKESTIEAYLLGDIDNNKIINDVDFNTLRSNISNEENQEYNFIYDINQDRQVNNDDLTELASIISLAKKSGENPSSKYVCPTQKKEETSNNTNEKQILITDYQLENKNCIVKTIVRVEKKSKYSCK